MDVTCTRCAGWIEQSNVRFPGYCSPNCNALDRADRDARLADEAARRRAQREAEATRPQVLT